ncbi:hypothetical protein LLG10_02520 [bacterium]|nr:hypothetical protein [bacterium]
MSFKKCNVILMTTLLLAAVSCKKPAITITSEPIPFTPLPQFVQGIENPENSWFFQIPSSQDEKGLYIPIQSDSDGNVYFIGRDQHFYSLNPKGTLQWSKEGAFQPVLRMVDNKTLLTMLDAIRLYNLDGSVKSIWMETGTCFLGPDGYIYTTLPSQEKKELIFSSLDARGNLRWKAPYQVKYGGHILIDGLWFDDENNVYYFVEDISEDKKFTDVSLFSFTSNGIPRWKKNFPSNKTLGFPFNQTFQSYVMFPLYSVKEETIQMENSKWLIGLNRNGDEIWRKEEKRAGIYSVPFQVCPNGQFVTALSSIKEGVTFVSSYNNLGEVIWERKLIGSEISPILADQENHTYIAAGGMSGDRYLYAFNPDGSTKWKIKIPTPLSTEVETMYLGNDQSIYLTLKGKNIIYKVSQAVP